MKQYFEIIKYAKVWISLAIFLIVTSLVIFYFNNIKKDISNVLESQWYKKYDIYLNYDKNITDLLIKVDVNDDKKVANLSKEILFLIKQKYIDNESQILAFSVVWPSIWEYVKKSAILAIVWWLILMSIYILFAFIEIKEYISPFLLALITILTMIFDISIPAWAYGILMGINSTIQVDVIFVIAILTIMWYSINDTIVIFDRIRENLRKLKEKGVNITKQKYAEVFELSLWQTMRRSLWTSISTFLVVLAMWFFGTSIIKLFAFTMAVGIIAGTFSSIFFAAPLAYYLTVNKYK